MDFGRRVRTPALRHPPIQDAITRIYPDSAVDVSSDGIWFVSTYKPGNGVQFARDDNTETYWQSDGQQPHVISLVLGRRCYVVMVAIYVDFARDESYTPCSVSVCTGVGSHNVQEVATAQFEENTGWEKISLARDGEEGVYANIVLVRLLSNFQNGRDCRVRQIAVYARSEDEPTGKLRSFDHGFSTLR